MVVAMLSIGLLGFIVWAHHMGQRTSAYLWSTTDNPLGDSGRRGGGSEKRKDGDFRYTRLRGPFSEQSAAAPGAHWAEGFRAHRQPIVDVAGVTCGGASAPCGGFPRRCCGTCACQLTMAGGAVKIGTDPSAPRRIFSSGSRGVGGSSLGPEATFGCGRVPSWTCHGVPGISGVPGLIPTPSAANTTLPAARQPAIAVH